MEMGSGTGQGRFWDPVEVVSGTALRSGFWVLRSWEMWLLQWGEVDFATWERWVLQSGTRWILNTVVVGSGTGTR